LAAVFILLTVAAALYGNGVLDGAVINDDGSQQSVWLIKSSRLLSIKISDFILVLVFILSALVLAISIRGIGGAIKENTAIRLNAEALVAGDLLPMEKKKRMARIKRRIGGLRLKLASFTMVLVLAVDVIALVPLYIMMIQSQKQTLLKSLLDRSTVLLEGLAANAQTYLSQGNIQDLRYLPDQMISIPEAQYVTITGYNPDTFIFEDQVWATNDPNIHNKIDSQKFHPGYSRIIDAVSPRLPGIAAELNAKVQESLGAFLEDIVRLNQEALELAGQTETPEIARRLEEIQNDHSELETRITEALTGIAGKIKSEPDYSFENLTISQNRRYLFYKPIMLNKGPEDVFLGGVARVEISIASILENIDREQKILMRISLLVALVAQTVGVIGALVLSNFIIRPIRQLVKHVEIIRDTKDLTRLRGVNVRLKSNDELAVLGNTINDMTHGLVKAARAASELSIGKEFQKKFIPLEMDREGNKLSSGFEETAFFSLFGYYEGAKEVSGDYFDYQDLDGRYYAIIKCDVAGKGVPASFIMIQVATMFLNYCKLWKPTEQGMHIENLVYQINEFIENLAFEDRFAAFTLCLYDSHTGEARFCNAGDNIIHLYSASEEKYKTITLPATPAAGVLSNIMVESKGGYKAQSITLNHGDILLLFTDGIEESLRKFRNAKFEEIQCSEGQNDTPHENHVAGQWGEELGLDRIQDIVSAVMNKKIYTLYKWHNGEGEENKLQFDFRNSKGTIRDVIMAMVSIEKMFRCYHNPKATEESLVPVDRIVDAFLRKYFLEYQKYCAHIRENPGNAAYMYYTYVMEDEQSDDLTLLGIQRK
jgi:hypothetical protein